MPGVAFTGDVLRRGHGDDTATLARLVKAVEQRDTEDDWAPFGQSLFPGLQLERHLLHVFDTVVGADLVGIRIGLLDHEPLVEGPGLLVADAEFRQAFHGELNDAAIVLVLRSVTPASIVIDEQAAGVLRLLRRRLDPILVGTRNRIRDAGIRVALVLDVRHLRTQIDLGRQVGIFHEHTRLIARGTRLRRHRAIARRNSVLLRSRLSVPRVVRFFGHSLRGRFIGRRLGTTVRSLRFGGRLGAVAFSLGVQQGGRCPGRLSLRFAVALAPAFTGFRLGLLLLLLGLHRLVGATASRSIGSGRIRRRLRDCSGGLRIGDIRRARGRSDVADQAYPGRAGGFIGGNEPGRFQNVGNIRNRLLQRGKRQIPRILLEILGKLVAHGLETIEYFLRHMLFLPTEATDASLKFETLQGEDSRKPPAGNQSSIRPEYRATLQTGPTMRTKVNATGRILYHRSHDARHFNTTLDARRV